MDYLLNLFIFGVVGAFIAVLVTYIEYKYGAKSSGLLSAFPTVSATSLFIIALENGNSFASKASLSSLFGLAAVNFFTFGFYYGYVLVSNFPQWFTRKKTSINTYDSIFFVIASRN